MGMSVPIHKIYLSAWAMDRSPGPDASFTLDQLSLPPSKKSPSSLSGTSSDTTADGHAAPNANPYPRPIVHPQQHLDQLRESMRTVSRIPSWH